MRKKDLIKILVVTVVTGAIITLNPIQSNAEWKNYNNGWWYIEGNSYVKGWKQINGKWYYFNNNGRMLFNTITPDGYIVDINGVWDGRTQETFSNKKTLETKQQVYSLGTTIINIGIYNNTNKILSYGEYFLIEKLEDNQWIELPFGRNVSFNDLAYTLAIGANSEEKCKLTSLKDFDNLTPGKYRVVKKINKEIMYAEFELI